MPTFTTQRTTQHHFVPEEFDGADSEAVTEQYRRLQERDANTREELERLILDWEELGACVYQAYSIAYVDMTSDTTNKESESKYLKILEDVLPVFEQKDFVIKQKILGSPALEELGEEYKVFLRNVRSEVELFREENVPLFTEERKLSQEHEKISGAQEAEVQGEKQTLPQLARLLEEPDRAVREEAWRARAEVRLRDAAAIDEIYDKMYELRQRIAHNAGFDNYRDYIFQQLKRFDYTPEDCETFHRAIAQHIVPVITRENEKRKRMLGVETLRPWDVIVDPRDLAVDPEGHEPMRPFDGEAQLKEGGELIFRQIDEELGGFFRQMMDEKLLDLDNRPGKAPGGYMTSFPDSKVPFIFMNAVGTKRDVDTVLHEGGHAFHYFLARELPLRSYHHTGSEFSEVASMSMELLARPYLGEFYSEEDRERLDDEQLLSTLNFFPFMAMVDAFQHWVYTSEEHGAEARKSKWTELSERFRPGIDWSGLEQYREVGWQYPHVMDSPFYYVEYGIAQLAAFQVWLNSLKNEREAVAAYKRGLALGGSKTLPELFEAAGAEFSFGDETVGRIVEGAMSQMKRTKV